MKLKIVLAVFLLSIPGFSRQSVGTKPAFEAATIKPSMSTDNRVMIMGQPGGRFTVTNATLKMVMAAAYRVRDTRSPAGQVGRARTAGISRAKPRKAVSPSSQGHPIQRFPIL